MSKDIDIHDDYEQLSNYPSNCVDFFLRFREKDRKDLKKKLNINSNTNRSIKIIIITKIKIKINYYFFQNIIKFREEKLFLKP